MTRSISPERVAHTEAALSVHAPELIDGFRTALPEAADTVGRRLRGALIREGIRDMGPGEAHAFNRVEYPRAGVGDPVELLDGIDAPGFAAELRNAVINLAIAMARPAAPVGDGPDWQAIGLERLAVAGHNLHPCGRTRLGWDTSDVLAHDLEAPMTRLGFVAVRDELHVGDDVFPTSEMFDMPGYRRQPMHVWQRDAILPSRYGDLLRDGSIRILDDELDAAPTAALRTLWVPSLSEYLKVSLDIQVTSTRRSISVASTRNGPAVSALLHRLVDDERVMLMAETAGAAVPAAGSGRDLSAIRRDGLAGRIEPGERVIPGGALPFLLSSLVKGDHATWLTEYVQLLLPPLMRLTAQGVALEAHLQNCLPTFVDGRPHRVAFRDFAGLRLHRPRLAAAGHDIDLWPGSVVGTDDLDVFRAKIGYTLFQAHLGEIILRLDIDEARAWRIVRAVLDDCCAGDDHAAFTAPLVPHKALVRMRLDGGGDVYIPVRNPLHAR